MHIYDIKDVLSADYYFTRFDSKAIEQLLFDYLKPELMKITVISKKYKPISDRIEKWYGTEYNMKILKKSTLDNLNNCSFEIYKSIFQFNT